MNLKKYWILTSLATFILLPVWLNGSLLLLGMTTAANPLLLPLGILPFLALIYAIYRFGKKATLPDTFLSRYGPLIAPILFILVAWLLMAFLNGGDFTKSSYVNFGLVIFLPSFVFLFIAALSGSLWVLPVSSVASCLFFMACFAVGTWRGKRFATRGSNKALHALALVLILAFAAAVQRHVQYQHVLPADHMGLRNDASQDDTDTYTLSRDYAPFSGRTRLVSPKTPPSLQIDQDYPRLDGAVALIPIYAAAANAIYQENKEQGNEARKKAVGFSETSPAAYKALLDGQADIIFALAPSEEQVKEAAKKGITYTSTPIGREAFVFLVNEKNPVTNLSVKQVRDIYSGKIDNWQKVGGAPGKILAFQRNEGSGSQTAMQRYVMRGASMRRPLEIEYHESMGGIVRRIADYRNLDHAIGYSFRYYATVMYSTPGIRLLSIDNVAPTVENIRNGTYPFTGDIHMVTARPLSENARKLHDWFLSEEGQQLIEEVGYVPLKGDSR